MNKPGVVIGIMLVSIGFLAHKCVKLEKKLTQKSVECAMYKVGYNVYKTIYADSDDDAEAT